MNPYASIETVYRRDPVTKKIDISKIRAPETHCITGWRIREKIDGTNIRVICRRHSVNGLMPTIFKQVYTDKFIGVDVKGRSDRAQIPPGITEVIESLFTDEILYRIFDVYMPNEDSVITFYGEGYGPGITGSEKMNYRPHGKAWRCFDIKLGDSYWLPDTELDDACNALKIPTAPYMGYHAHIPVSSEDLSLIIDQSEVTWVDYMKMTDITPPYQRAEGIVAKPETTLFDASGNRVMWKICYRDLD